MHVLCFWDKNAENIKYCKGTPVYTPLADKIVERERERENCTIIICIGNNVLRAKLRVLAEKAGFNVLSDMLTLKIFRSALGDPPVFIRSHSLAAMTNEERLSAAFEYAASSNYAMYDHEKYYRERTRFAKNLVFASRGFSPRSVDFFENYVKNNGLVNLTALCGTPKGSFLNLPEYSPEQVAELDDPFVVLLNSNWKDMEEKLRQHGIPFCTLGDLELSVFDHKLEGAWFKAQKEHMLRAYRLFEDEVSKNIFADVVCNRIAPQYSTRRYGELMPFGTSYWDRTIFDIGEHECLVDAGAFDGDSLSSFLDAVDNQFDAVYAYEFDKENFLKLKACAESTPNSDKIFVIPKGVSDKEETVSVGGSSSGGTSICKDGDQTVELVPLDRDLEGKRITFIKMDIEGSEMAALRGSSTLISTQKPKCAISCYHHFSDLWNVPLLLKSLNKEYRFFLRHHSDCVWDTVCYAR